MGVGRLLRDASRRALSDLTTRARVHQRWTAPRHHNHCSTTEHPEILFYEAMQRVERPRVLEVGSRRIVAPLDRTKLGPSAEYVGMDILAGSNVDVVGDAHELTRHFGENSFDGIISFAVFEHIAMPWTVALEINKLLRPGGLVYIATHHAYPIHELPWDFWRYGYDALGTIFGEATGFATVSSLLGWSAHVYPNGGLTALDADGEHYLFSGVLARKERDFDRCACRWDADYRDALPAQHHYPEGKYSKGDERYEGPVDRMQARVVDAEALIASPPPPGSALVVAADGVAIPAPLSSLPVERVSIACAARDLAEIAVRARSQYDRVYALNVLENVRHPWVSAGDIASCVREGGELVAREHTTAAFRAGVPDLWRFTSESLRIVYHPILGLECVDSAFIGPLLVVADESEKQGLERNNRTFEYAYSRFRKTSAGRSPGVWPDEPGRG